MTPRPLRVCPACRRPARTKPLPPEGFWQEQVLQRLRMYPYRCEACGARFYRKVRVAKSVVPPQRSAHPMPPAQDARAGKSENAEARVRSAAQAADGRRPATAASGTVPERGEQLSHAGFVDLIDEIRRSEQRAKSRDREKDRESD